MGPRLINRGNSISLKVKVLNCIASMGPRLINRGNETESERFLAEVQLQWGRG